MSNALRCGREEGLIYSFSRWTDLPAAKWPWFQERLEEGWFVGINPRTALPGKWSLKPEDTLGLVFWTRDPTNLIRNAKLLQDYPLVIHMTVTGWHEVEKGAPDMTRALFLLEQAVEKFGPDKIVWRFSPVPLVDDAVERFQKMAAAAESLGLQEVYVAFLQENDYLPETRPMRVRRELLHHLAASTKLRVRLCAEQTSTWINTQTPANLGIGVCEDGGRFVSLGGTQSRGFSPRELPIEGCGCALAVDPFTINESCVFGCAYCYAADEKLTPHKRNTTKRHLPVT